MAERRPARAKNDEKWPWKRKEMGIGARQNGKIRRARKILRKIEIFAQLPF